MKLIVDRLPDGNDYVFKNSVLVNPVLDKNRCEILGSRYIVYKIEHVKQGYICLNFCQRENLGIEIGDEIDVSWLESEPFLTNDCLELDITCKFFKEARQGVFTYLENQRLIDEIKQTYFLNQFTIGHYIPHSYKGILAIKLQIDRVEPPGSFISNNTVIKLKPYGSLLLETT